MVGDLLSLLGFSCLVEIGILSALVTSIVSELLGTSNDNCEWLMALEELKLKTI